LLVNPTAFVQFCSSSLVRLAMSPATRAFDTHGEVSDTSTFVYVDGVYAITGGYARDAFGDTHEQAGYVPETDETADGVYVHENTGEVAGVSDDVFAYAPRSDNGDESAHTATVVARILSTAAGDQPWRSETHEEFGRLLRNGGTDGIAVGCYSSAEPFTKERLERVSPEPASGDLEFQFGSLEGATGIHQRLSIDGDEDAVARAVVRYPTAESANLGRLESSFGTSVSDGETLEERRTAVIEAEYDAAALETA
jgi:hypothetical protein